MLDFYSILGLTKKASDIEIKTAFRKLVKIYHPDKNPNDPNSKKIFENISKALFTVGALKNIHAKVTITKVNNPRIINGIFILLNTEK